MMTLFKEVGIAGFLDMAFMTLIIYSVSIWFKKTKAAFVLTGIIIIAGVYLLAREFNLVLTATIFRGFFAIILVAVVVIFQEELRHFFEQVAIWSLNRRTKRTKKAFLLPAEVTTLVRTVVDLAKEKIGALIVIQGKDAIVRHIHGGVDLSGKLSEPLLKSLFDPHSIGHDGAVVIERGTIARFAAKLPLTKDLKKIGYSGTRHAAALGITELSDAFCIVVSEERGTISIAHNGMLRTMDSPDMLSRELDRFYREINPPAERKVFQEFFRKNQREKIIALVLSVALWSVVVYGSRSAYRTYTLPIEYSVLPSTLVVNNLEPQKVDVSVSGPRRAFYFLSKKDLRLYIKIWNLEEGTWQLKISKSDISIPKSLVVENIEPPAVRVTLSGSDTNNFQNRSNPGTIGD